MKLFNTVKELWDYCEFCPMCQKNCRAISLSIGPDHDFDLHTFSKIKDQLTIECYSIANDTEGYNVDIIVDMNSNNFELKAATQDEQYLLNNSYFYFYLYAKCPVCKSGLNTSDLEKKDFTISNIAVEREEFYCQSDKGQFYIDVLYDDELLILSTYDIVDEEIVVDDKDISLPLFKLDFSDMSKLINKLKTFIIFS